MLGYLFQSYSTGVWAIIFILVQLQMMTALRPLIGTSETFLPREKKFFAAHWIDCLEKPKPQNSR